MVVYKYVVPERIDVLENGCIRFTQADSLNDPFEIRPCFDLRKKWLTKFSREHFAREAPEIQVIERELEIQKTISGEIRKLEGYIKRDYLVLSLTKERNNLAMWSHYTDSYKGFVIGFDSDNPFFHQEKPRAILPLSEVRYSNKRPFFPESNEDINESTIEILLTKSNHWEYEDELRMFAKSEVADQVIQRGDGTYIYLFDFPTECISELIFGYQMEDILKEQIVEITEQRYKNAVLFEAHLSETDFDLDIQGYRSVSK